MAMEETTSQIDRGEKTLPDLNELAGMMRKAFEQHVDGLVTASINGVKIVPKKHLDNVQVELHVSPSAYAALKTRFGKTPK